MLIMEAHSFRHTTKSTHAGPADVHFWCHWLFSCNFNTLWLNINKTKGIDRAYLQFPLWFPVARVYTDNGAPYNNVKIWTHKPFWVPSVMSNLPPTHINLNWGKFDFGIRTGTVLMRHRSYVLGKLESKFRKIRKSGTRALLTLGCDVTIPPHPHALRVKTWLQWHKSVPLITSYPMRRRFYVYE